MYVVIVHQITVFHYYSSSVPMHNHSTYFLLYLNIQNMNHSAIRLTSYSEHIFFLRSCGLAKNIYILLC